MMTPIVLAFALAVMQQPGGAPPLPPPLDTAEAGRLRRQIEQRFAQRVQQELRLTDDQAGKLRATEERYGERRRGLMRQQLERRMALQNQMQPGVAANADSVRKLMDGLQAARAEMLKLEQDQDREMGAYLTPVQRARYQMMREGLMRRLNEMRQQRQQRQGDRMGPRPRGARRPGPPRRPI